MYAVWWVLIIKVLEMNGNVYAGSVYPNEEQTRLADELLELKFKLARGTCPVKSKLANSTITVDKRGLKTSERFGKLKQFDKQKSNVAFYLNSQIKRTNTTYFCKNLAQNSLFAVLTTLASES